MLKNMRVISPLLGTMKSDCDDLSAGLSWRLTAAFRSYQDPHVYISFSMFSCQSMPNVYISFSIGPMAPPKHIFSVRKQVPDQPPMHVARQLLGPNSLSARVPHELSFPSMCMTDPDPLIGPDRSVAGDCWGLENIGFSNCSASLIAIRNAFQHVRWLVLCSVATTS